MNVKELIMSQPPAAIAAILLDKFRAKPDDRERAMKRLLKFIEGLNQIEPIDSGHLILGIFHVDEDGDFLNPCLYRKGNLEAGFTADSEFAGLENLDGLSEEEIERLAISEIFRSPMRLNSLPGMRSLAMKSMCATPVMWGRLNCALLSSGK